MPILPFNDREYLVELDHDNTKPHLLGFSIDGVHRGNVHINAESYRIGWKTTKKTVSSKTPINDVILEAARLYLQHEEDNKEQRRNQ